MRLVVVGALVLAVLSSCSAEALRKGRTSKYVKPLQPGQIVVSRNYDLEEEFTPAQVVVAAATGCETPAAPEPEPVAAPVEPPRPVKVAVHKLGCTGDKCEQAVTIVHASPDAAEPSGKPCHDCVEDHEHVQKRIELTYMKVHAEEAAAAEAEAAAAAAPVECVNCVDSEDKAAELLAAAKARVLG